MANSQNSVAEIIKSLDGDLKKVEKIILDFAVGKSPLIAEISRHLIASGGKRIRPVLLILSDKICGNKSGENSLNLAAAVELIHSATLLHDDVVGKSEVRRGKKTANAIWDNKATILVGDYLFSIAFQLMVRSQNLAVLDLLAKTSSIMADGEVMQLENSSEISLSVEKYLDIIFGKTAVLFSAACESAALANGVEAFKIEALRDFGRNLGIIFQIVDDILDYSSQQAVFGKEIGNDFFEGKVILPIILARQNANESDQKIIADLLLKNLIGDEKNQENLQQIIALINKNRGLEASKDMALEFYEKAVKNLEIFENCEAKENLLAILEYSLQRVS